MGGTQTTAYMSEYYELRMYQCMNFLYSVPFLWWNRGRTC